MTHFKHFCLCFLITAMASSQEYTKSLEGVEWVRIESKARIRVTAHEKSQLVIKPGPKIKTPERAAGLKLVGEGGPDNTDIGFYVVKEGSNLIIRNLRKSENETAEIYLPAKQNIFIKCDGLNDMEIEGFSGEIEASSEVTGNITLTNVTGPLTVDSNTGTVVVAFGKVNQSSPISISTATGEIDVTLPKDTAADLTLQSTMGEIYSNFELSVPDKNGLKAISSQKVNGSINNGGVKIQLNSATGNIYLRKK